MACVIIISQMGAINFEWEDCIILQYYQINRQVWEAFSKSKIVNRYSAVTLILSSEAYGAVGVTEYHRRCKVLRQKIKDGLTLKVRPG